MSDEDMTREQLLLELKTLRTAAVGARESCFEAFMDNSPALSFIKDEAGRYVYLSRAAHRLLGREPAIYVGRTDHDIFPPEVARKLQENDLAVFALGQALERIETVTGMDGSPRHGLVIKFPFQARSGTWLLGGLGVDITASRQAEEKLRQSEQRLAEAQRVAQIGSWERDLRTNQVTWSDELYRLFGLSPQKGEMSYERFLSLLQPEDAVRVRRLFDQALRDRSSFACEYCIITPAGEQRILHERGEFVLDETGQPVRLVGTAQDITERGQPEERQREYADTLQAMSRRLVAVQEEERRHLARELHDEIGQLLTSLKFALEATWTAPPENAEAKIGEARRLIDEVLRRVRQMSVDLRPALLDQLGLLPALRWLIERYTTDTDVSVNFKNAGLDKRLSAEVETAAFRIVQEALTNVARHAQVKDAAVRIWIEGDFLEIQVEDEGAGFDVAGMLAVGRCNGLPGIQERVMLLGGRLSIDAAPGSGTHLLAALPLGGNGERKSP